jgi:hypothetical protein
VIPDLNDEIELGQGPYKWQVLPFQLPQLAQFGEQS